jgi:hypothetical protein
MFDFYYDANEIDNTVMSKIILYILLLINCQNKKIINRY